VTVPDRILVIEDNPTNLDLVLYLLRAAGHEPRTARDGASGLDEARLHRPALVLLDLQMPGMDGFEVLRRLRADPALASVPVVAVTALAMVGDRERILAAGFDGYIPKPIVPEAFLAQVASFLPRKPDHREDR
jgi:CheY-like chemotaxis protein